MSEIDKEIIEAMAAKGWLIPQTEREVQMAEQLLKQDKVIKLQAAALEVWKSGKANKPGVVPEDRDATRKQVYGKSCCDWNSSYVVPFLPQAPQD